jgi:ABC-type bacteriocin/lantibiotic exporter with double-glycine peptidase domain
MSNSFLNIDNISYSYSGSSWRLDSISLDISKGDFIGIAGANGSGNTYKITFTYIQANTIQLPG